MIRSINPVSCPCDPHVVVAKTYNLDLANVKHPLINLTLVHQAEGLPLPAALH